MDANAVKLSSTYPSAPMIYINNYTNDNVRLGQVPAPPAIIKDNYTCFGKQIDPNEVFIKPLESHNIKCLYKTTTASATTTASTSQKSNYKYELKKLNHSILIAYLDLIDILVKSPNKIGKSGGSRTLREEKLDDLNILFLNMHHLINELRPKQARENLITILEMQRDQRLDIVNKFQKHLLIIMDLLNQSIEKIKVNSNELSSLLNEFNSLINENKKQQQQQQQDTKDDDDESMMLIDNQINEEQERQERISNYEYKDRVLCNIIDNFLNNKIKM